MLPVERIDAERAKDILLGSYGLSARDALHVAVMLRHDIVRIRTFDRGFDAYPGVRRVH